MVPLLDRRFARDDFFPEAELISTKLAMDLAGWFGAFVLLFAYAGVSFKRMAANSFVYQGLNALGSICLTLNTLYYRAYPSAFVNVIWIAIAFAAGMRVARTEKASM